MISLQTQDTSPQISLLDAAMDAASGRDPGQYVIAQIEESLRKSGSTWMKRQSSQFGVRVEDAWYAQNHDGNSYLTSKRYGEAEVFLANWMRSRNHPEMAVELVGTGLTESQKAVAKVCLSNQVSCLSGLPGTGKTYTCRAIAESYRRAGFSVVGCSLTGIAASRLKDSAQIETSTIHRLLGWRGRESGYTVKVVDADIVMLDEASMPDNQLYLSLVSRLRKDTRLILIGDPNQLSGIDPGDAFRELCKVMPHGRLIEVLRQEKDSPIGHAAERILSGNVPTNEDSESGGGCYVIQCDGLALSMEEYDVKDGKRYRQRREKNHPLTVAERMSELDKTELRFIRTMASTNDTVNKLNQLFTTYKKVKSEHPIMCIQNNHDLGVYNGEIGYKEWRRCRFGEVCTYFPDRQIADAWCTTVDKMQGNECISGQLVIEPFLGVRRAYTALTRAKHRFCFTGDIATLEKCLHTPEEPRVTLLSGLIEGSVRYTDTSC